MIRIKVAADTSFGKVPASPGNSDAVKKMYALNAAKDKDKAISVFCPETLPKQVTSFYPFSLPKGRLN